MITATVPERGEAVDYYFTYIDKVPAGRDIVELLEEQGRDTLALLEGVPAERTSHRYEPDKWTVAEVLNHINDCERLFVFRAMWFARGFDSELPSFDQGIAMRTSGAGEVPWAQHVEEFRALRAASVAFFRNLPAEAWMRRGIASGNPFTVHALAYIAAGHVAHHVGILRERYQIRP